MIQATWWPFSYRSGLAALSLFLGIISGAIFLYSRGVLVRDQIVDFDASRAEISFAFTAVQIVGTLSAPVLGFLIDRYPLRNVMMAGAAWLGLGFFAMSQASSIVQFAILTATVVGLGTGTIGTAANAKLMVEWFDRNRGVALAVAIMGYSLAGIVMPPIALYLLDSVGWRQTYMLFGCVCLLAVLPVIALVVRQRPSESAAGRDNAGRDTAVVAHESAAQSGLSRSTSLKSQLSAYRTLARSRPFWGVVMVFGLLSGVSNGLNLHLFLHYTDLGIGDYEATSILSFSAALAVLSKPLFGWVVDRRSPITATLMVIALCAAAMAAFVFATSYWSLLFAGGLSGLAFGAIVLVQVALLSRLVPEAEFGRAYGALRLCMFPIMVLWTPLIGVVHELTGSYSILFKLFAATFGVVLVATRVLIPPGAVQR